MSYCVLLLLFLSVTDIEDFVRSFRESEAETIEDSTIKKMSVFYRSLISFDVHIQSILPSHKHTDGWMRTIVKY